MRKTYTPEYKAYVIKLIVEEGRKVKQVSRELEIPYPTITQWLEKYRAQKPLADENETPLTPSEYKKQLAAYEKELRQVQEENDILKKLCTFLPKTRNDLPFHLCSSGRAYRSENVRSVEGIDQRILQMA